MLEYVLNRENIVYEIPRIEHYPILDINNMTTNSFYMADAMGRHHVAEEAPNWSKKRGNTSDQVYTNQTKKKKNDNKKKK